MRFPFPRALGIALLLQLGCATPALADLALASAKNCMSCHTVQRKVVGPSFKEIAAKYRDRPGAADLLAGKIVKGGSGMWGIVSMPANPQVSEADAKKLAAWILSTP